MLKFSKIFFSEFKNNNLMKYFRTRHLLNWNSQNQIIIQLEHAWNSQGTTILLTYSPKKKEI
jgi:hypothetical protein